MTLTDLDWDAHYKNQNTPWDLAGPTPEFERLLAEKRLHMGLTLIPGAGRSYDAILLAQHGYEVDVVDFAPTALRFAAEAAVAAHANVHVFRHNFFDLPRLAQHVASYDLFLEYTFFCAIDPSRRKEYVQVAASMLKTGGQFVGLFFPLSTEKAGPPFVVSQEEVRELFSPHFLISFEEPKASVKPRAGREFLALMTRT